MNAHLSLSTAVVLAPRRAGLRAGQDNLVEVLVRIQAPDAPPGPVAPRPPQALALVIDRSGSMHGRPLAEARRCAEVVVGKMRPTDAVALVQFDHRVQRLWPAVPLGDGVALRAAIAGIQAGGNTQLHGGWLEGAQALADGAADAAGHTFKRVILLSDGCANDGLTDTATIAAQCAQ
jgi:Ca-activated chloride channel family protein